MNRFKDLIATGDGTDCPRPFILALHDTLNVVGGKWKLPIIAALLRGKSRFKELRESMETITPRMLSRELKELEMNGMIERTVHNQTPLVIEYRLTTSGKEIIGVIDAMIDWGLTHRKSTMGMGGALVGASPLLVDEA